MTLYRRFECNDLLRFNNVNLDPLTATYNNAFYLQYVTTWPDMQAAAVSAHGSVCGYILGKVEGRGTDWHGHVTAVTVAPEYRKLGYATRLMHVLEHASTTIHNGFFVDLFVRKSNDVGINMYKKMGYVIYRRVVAYYSGDEDAYDMRKALPRDVNKDSEREYPGGVCHPHQIEYP